MPNENSDIYKRFDQNEYESKLKNKEEKGLASKPYPPIEPLIQRWEERTIGNGNMGKLSGGLA